MFGTQYNAVPGDMPDADTVFKPFTGITVYNGNGNSVIEYSGGGMGEGVNAWNHLAMAGYVQTKFYTDSLGSSVSAIGHNLPKGAHGASVYYMINANINIHGTGGLSFAADSAYFIGLENQYDNALVFSNSIFYLGYNDPISRNGILTPDDALAIDTKMDDGKYGSGRISGMQAHGATSTCSDGGTGYNPNDNQPDCILLFNLEKRNSR